MIAQRFEVKIHRDFMDRDAASSLADAFAAAQDWWREAGVDCDFTDDPVVWLKDAEAQPDAAAEKPAAPAVAQKIAPPPPSIGGDEAGWPSDLAAFGQWWLEEPSLDAGGANPRIAPRGAPGAKLMILVAYPEREDRDTLLSGPQGRLFASFLNAAGLTEDVVYFASALPRHTPHPDWAALNEAGLGRIALHHVALARPERLLLFGKDILALFGNNPAQDAPFLLNLNQQGSSIRTLAARSLDHMLNIPSARARFWREWLDWTDG